MYLKSRNLHDHLQYSLLASYRFMHAVSYRNILECQLVVQNTQKLILYTFLQYASCFPVGHDHYKCCFSTMNMYLISHIHSPGPSIKEIQKNVVKCCSSYWYITVYACMHACAQCIAAHAITS